MDLPKLHLSLSIDFDMWFYLMQNPYGLNSTIWRFAFEYLSSTHRTAISELFKVKKPTYVLIQLRFDDEGKINKTLFKDYYD